MYSLFLKPGREKSLKRRHPWVFAGAVSHVKGEPASGETVRVLDSNGQCLGLAAYSPKSQIVARLWSFDCNQAIDEAFFRLRLQRAIDRRRNLLDSGATNAARLVFSESDGLPGVIVDRFGDVVVCQFLSAGAEKWKDVIVSALRELLGDLAFYQRSDTSARKKEGLEKVAGPISGEIPNLVEMRENGVRFQVDVRNGHKTGFYLDQRDNRAALGAVARGRDLLDCFAYQGGFGVTALANGASSVTFVEASEEAQAAISRNLALNDIAADRAEQITDDVFKRLRLFRDQGRDFDLIVLDPPKFAESHAQINKASRGYKDINRLALKLLRPGGRLFTFSCSGHIKPELFQKVVADAALDARRDVWIEQRLDQAGDHIVALNYPEAHYLKGLVCRVD